MRVFEHATYWEIADICTDQFFTIGRSKEVYKVVDHARHWSDNGTYDKIIVVTDSKNRYRVFKCCDLVGKKITAYLHWEVELFNR